MAAIKPNNPDTNKPAGSLEDLFRHHLAEAEVPVRPMLWEQIDNSLLIEQNALYRRRLTATRWVAAASLALASLAGGGWWAAQPAPGNGSELAATQIVPAQSESNTNRPGGAAARVAVAAKMSVPTPTQSTDKQAALTSQPSAQPLMANTTNRSEALISTHKQANAPSHHAYAMARSVAASGSAKAGWQQGESIAVASTDAAASSTTVGLQPAKAVGLRGGESASATWASSGNYLTTNRNGQRFGSSPTGESAANAETGAYAADASLTSLNSRSTSLQLAANKTLPTGLTTLPVTPAALPVPLAKWQFGASYAVSAFNPNINFSREGSTDYIYNLSPALGDNSPALSETAAAEYRQHLQAGTGQRLALHATRRLGKGRWSLTTGVEVAQTEARSATSLSYVGEQLYDLGQTAGNAKLRDTQFRYRTAGVPVEVAYANPLKRGWSTYGRVGAVVSALFSVRAEVVGFPEASRTYSLQSAGGVYRKVLANVRGAAGVQFRPAAGSYTLSLGPVAEAGLLSLNAHPTEDFLHQNRAYSFGVEAGVAFGK